MPELTDSTQWGTTCKWDDERPWHVAMPPKNPHYLKEERKDKNGRPVILFEQFFNKEKAYPEGTLRFS